MGGRTTPVRFINSPLSFLALRWLLKNYFSSIITDVKIGVWGLHSCLPIWRISYRLGRANPLFNEGHIIGHAIDFKFSENENIFIVLLQNDFKHKRIQMTVPLLVILIGYRVIIHFVYSVNRKCWNRFSQVTNAMVVVLVVPQGPIW